MVYYRPMTVRWFNSILVFLSLLLPLISLDSDGQHDGSGIEETTLYCAEDVTQRCFADCCLPSGKNTADIASSTLRHGTTLLNADFVFVPRANQVLFVAPALAPFVILTPPVHICTTDIASFVTARGPPIRLNVPQSPGLRAPPIA